MIHYISEDNKLNKSTEILCNTSFQCVSVYLTNQKTLAQGAQFLNLCVESFLYTQTGLQYRIDTVRSLQTVSPTFIKQGLIVFLHQLGLGLGLELRKVRLCRGAEFQFIMIRKSKPPVTGTARQYSDLRLTCPNKVINTGSMKRESGENRWYENK